MYIKKAGNPKAIISIFFIISAIIFPHTSFSEISRFERMWPAIQQMWHFTNPEGITVDGMGYVYVADTDNHRIQKFSPDGRLVTKWGRNGSGEGAFNFPRGIAIDKNGFVYVADTDNHRIQKFTSEGEFIASWGSPGSSNGEFSYPYGITSDNRGYVYVCDRENHRIQKFTSGGDFINKWGSLGTGQTEFNHPCGITTDKNGFIYITEVSNHRVKKYTSDGQYISEWGSRGSEDEKFDFPYGIAIDKEGNVYVSERYNNRIQKFSSSGEFIAKWGTYGSGEGQFLSCSGIALDDPGFVYVADTYNHRIQKFSPGGEFIDKWWTYGNGAGEFRNPSEVSLDNMGNVYVADMNNHRIHKFSPDGVFIKAIGTYGSSEGEFSYPSDIAIDSLGFIYVADSVNNRIQKFSPDGDFVIEWGDYGGDNGYFYNPGRIACDKQGFIYVADKNHHRIQKFSPDGDFIAKWGSLGTGNGQFKFPLGIAIDSLGHVYVADSYNHRIQKFTPYGNFIGKWGIEGYQVGEFQYPSGIAVDAYDFVYIVDTDNHRIQKFTPEGLFVSTFGRLGSSFGDLKKPLGLCVATDGRVYVADSENHRIQVFTPNDMPAGITKAIIVAGKGRCSQTGNKLWDTTQMCANLAWHILGHQGLREEDIIYFTSDTNLDLDNNGILDDVQGPPAKEAFSAALNELAEDTNRVLIYLIGPGGKGTFLMSQTEALNSRDLDAWLDDLQERIPVRVVLIYDASESGSFLPELTTAPGRERILISSSSSEENAFGGIQGSLSFSSLFWTQIFKGFNVKNAFEGTKAILEPLNNQTPILDDNGNGLGNEPEDGALAQNTIIGQGVEITNDLPVINDISPDQTINGTASATFYAEDITDNDGISWVCAVIRPPNYVPGSSYLLPCIDLIPDDKGTYEGTYDGFHSEGTYSILIYAMDRAGQMSVPKVTSIVSVNPPRRRAIIGAGYTDSDIFRKAIEHNASLAYDALLFQGYTDEDIYLICPESFHPGCDSASEMEGFSYAFETWAGQNTFDLLVYFVGECRNQSFQIDQNETLSASSLDLWLDGIQDNIQGNIAFIYDAGGSGSFLNEIAPPQGKGRILIASAGPDEPAHFLFDGTLSFSYLFWQKIWGGESLYDAFRYASDSITTTFNHIQAPLLDDNSDGIYEPEKDGDLARDYSTGILQSGDGPFIGAVSAVEAGERSALIRAEVLISKDDIEGVFGVIVPQDYEPAGLLSTVVDLPTLMLSPAGSGEYQGIYKGLSAPKAYIVTIYATDEEKRTSMPKPATLSLIQDNYEGDNILARANVIILESIPQHHNFYIAGDKDWVKFYGLSDEIYRIQVNNVGTNADPVIELYDTDGETLLDSRNLGFKGEDEFMNWECPKDGIYYAMVSQYDTNTFGEGTEYDLSVFCPFQPPVEWFIVGSVRDISSGYPIYDALISTSEGRSGITEKNGTYVIPHHTENSTITALASGYIKHSTDMDFSSFSSSSIEIDFDLEPDPNIPSALLSPGLNLFGYPAEIPEGYTSYDLMVHLGDANEVNMIQRYKNNTETATSDEKTYETTSYNVNGMPGEYEFGIQKGEGYLVYMNKGKRIFFDGNPDNDALTLSLETGMNIISIPWVNPGYTANDLLLNLWAKDEISSIDRYNSKTGAHETTYYFNGRSSGKRFQISDNEGYVVYNLKRISQ
ncbi:MAG: 6-bladed beta-propeller [bacterium]